LKALSSDAWSPERIEKDVEVTRKADRTGRRSESDLMLQYGWGKMLFLVW